MPTSAVTITATVALSTSELSSFSGGVGIMNSLITDHRPCPRGRGFRGYRVGAWGSSGGGCIMNRIQITDHVLGVGRRDIYDRIQCLRGRLQTGVTPGYSVGTGISITRGH